MTGKDEMKETPMRGKVFLTVLLLLAVVFAVACAGETNRTRQGLDINALASQVNQASLTVKSYRFRGDFTIQEVSSVETDALGSEMESSLEGELVIPLKIRQILTVKGLRSQGPSSDLEGLPREVVYDGKRLYTKWSESSPWDESGAGAGLSALQLVPSLNQIIGYLFSLTDVEPLSDEKVDGVETVHLRGRVPKRLIDRPFGVSHEGSMEVWIGKQDHLVRRARYQLTHTTVLLDSEASVPMRWDGDVLFFEFGAPIVIEAPTQ